MVDIGSLPCSAVPTESRMHKAKGMIDAILAARKLPPGDASSVFAYLRFLGSKLHGRCGLPALQPIAARQNQVETNITPALRSALLWLRFLLDAVGPRVWPSKATANTIWVLGDASEPESGPPVIAAILQVAIEATPVHAFRA